MEILHRLHANQTAHNDQKYSGGIYGSKSQCSNNNRVKSVPLLHLQPMLTSVITVHMPSIFIHFTCSEKINKQKEMDGACVQFTTNMWMQLCIVLDVMRDMQKVLSVDSEIYVDFGIAFQHVILWALFVVCGGCFLDESLY